MDLYGETSLQDAEDHELFAKCNKELDRRIKEYDLSHQSTHPEGAFQADLIHFKALVREKGGHQAGPSVSGLCSTDLVASLPLITFHPPRYDRSLRKKIIFDQIPKTGGSSLQTVLYEDARRTSYFGKNCKHLDCDYDMNNRNEILYGHMEFDQIHGLCGDRCVYTTLIREPKALFLSSWRYSKYILKTRPTDASVSEYILNQKYTQRTQFNILSSEILLAQLDINSRTDRTIALQAISDNFLVIGILEHWKETLLLFNYHFPWIRRTDKKKETKKKDSKKYENTTLDTLNPEALEKLDEIFREKYEYEFYDVMTARFQHHLASVCADQR